MIKYTEFVVRSSYKGKTLLRHVNKLWDYYFLDETDNIKKDTPYSISDNIYWIEINPEMRFFLIEKIEIFKFIN